jgi:hypothetical protein
MSAHYKADAAAQAAIQYLFDLLCRASIADTREFYAMKNVAVVFCTRKRMVDRIGLYATLEQKSPTLRHEDLPVWVWGRFFFIAVKKLTSSGINYIIGYLYDDPERPRYVEKNRFVLE